MLNYQRVSWKLFRWLSKIEKFHPVSWFVHLHKVVLRCDFQSKNFPRFLCWVCCITQNFCRWWFFAKFEFFWTVSGSIIDGKISKALVFFTLYFIHHSIDTVQVQHSWLFLRTHWQERLHQPQQARVLSVLLPSAKKTSAAKSQDYEFVLIIQWSSVKHLALEIWYPMVWISH